MVLIHINNLEKFRFLRFFAVLPVFKIKVQNEKEQNVYEIAEKISCFNVIHWQKENPDSDSFVK